MTGPKGSLATLRPDLGMAMLEFDLAANAAKMVALQVAPVLESQAKAGNWGDVAIEELLVQVKDDRARGQRYNSPTGLSAPEGNTFNCADHGIEDAVDDDDQAMFGDYFDAEVLTAQRCRNIVLSNLESDVAALVAATTYTATVTDWTNKSSGTPIADGLAQKNAFLLQSGLYPNVLVINELDANSMISSAEIVDRVKYAGIDDPKNPDMIARALAQLLRIEQVVIAGALKSTGNPGAQRAAGTATISTIWPTGYATFLRVARSQDSREPGFARTIHWGEDGSTIGAAIESYRDESRRSNMIRCRMNRDIKQRYAQAILRMKLGS